VNDAAALKQADIGVAMGSGSEVTKQAGRMILTDDNFGTLVHAVEPGRRIYGTITAYVRYQMTQLLSLVMLFVTATRSSTSTAGGDDPADGAVPQLLYLHLPGRCDRVRSR
jgi:P-type E1-E2 ATPase